MTVGTWDPKRASELENALVASGRPRVRKAILTDFDLSAHLQDSDYFAADHARSLSGSPYFYSTPYKYTQSSLGDGRAHVCSLTGSMSASEPYLQSPLDDLWAFLYNAVWATLLEVLPMSNQKIIWRLQLRSRSVGEREGTIKRITQVQDFQKKFPPMLRAMAPVIEDWLSALDQMEEAWQRQQQKASTTGGVGFADFNHLAYSGVQDFIRIFTNHRERLAGVGDDIPVSFEILWQLGGTTA
ncbi:hypothetical protein B0H15DRAFT_840154 [Mycena belliarum]|uniref:Uncharacterized protein n=1 Tax=Mycena belliarum TaxID=1033014 RepID=A0AAD6U5A8_9AGAR|nr:hypothetical protein B0H15DRAFT_840154 [Mycena belliae]